MRLVDELKHVLKTPRAVGRMQGRIVFAEPDFDAPGYEFKVREVADVADDLFAVAQAKEFFTRDAFIILKGKGESDRELFDGHLVAARTDRDDRQTVHGEDTLAVWEEWKDGERQLATLLYRNPKHAVRLHLCMSLGSNLLENADVRNRAYWDIGVREIHTSLPSAHYLVQVHLDRNYEIVDTIEATADVPEIVRLRKLLTERP